MKRLVLVAMLLLGGAMKARADNDIYNNALKQPRGDDALNADTAVCDAQFGAPQNGVCLRCAIRSAPEWRADLAAIQALHARARLALQPYDTGARQARRSISRSR